MDYGSALTALADPTRRALLVRVRRREHTVGELARALAVSQPAVSQHLRVLRRARLVAERRDGTRRWIRPSTQGLEQLRRWLDGMWDDVLGAFAGEAGTAGGGRKTRGGRRAGASRRSRRSS